MKLLNTAAPDVHVVDVEQAGFTSPHPQPHLRREAPAVTERPRRRYHFRKPNKADGSAMWALVKDTGVLDVNSAYSYLMLGEYFADTCVVAERDGEVVGFVSGFIPPEQPDTVFVWQVGVAPSEQGQGLAKRLLRRLLARKACRQVRYLETTVTPSNEASTRLFQSLARELNTICTVQDGFPEELFPDEGMHEPERLFRIGPFRAS